MQLSVNGVDTFVATGGRPFDRSLPAVVLLHGAGFDHSTWALHSRWFAHHGYSVLAPDLPGHGRSSGKPLPLTVGDTVTGRMVDARLALDFVAPTAFAPSSQVMTVGSVIGTTSIKATIGWPAATDDASGIGSYEVDQQVNGGAWSRVVSGTTARSVARSLVTATTYKFRVRARDRAGNVSPFVEGGTLTPKRYEETTSLTTYAGRWTLTTSTGASGGKVKFATTTTASVMSSSPISSAKLL